MIADRKDKVVRAFGEIVAAIGAVIILIAGCSLDSCEPYGTMAVIAVILGGMIAGAGYAIVVYESNQKKDLSQIHQQDRLNQDITYMSYDLNGKKVFYTKK